MPPRIITTASAYSKSRLFLITMEEATWRSDPFAQESRGYFFFQDIERPWSHNDVPASIVSVTRYRYPDRDRTIQVALTAEGDVSFIGREENYWEKIEGAGLDSDDAKGWGLMNAIRQVGDTLFACGQGGQVYERESRDRWKHIDAGLLRPLPGGKSVIFEDVNGPHEEALYVVGQEGSAYYRGKKGKFEELGLPTSAWLQKILVKDEKTVYLCGSGGALVVGNAVDGFKEVTPGETNEGLLSMALFEDRLYVASERAVYVVDGDRLHRVRTSLTPDLVDAHVLDAVPGALWSVGYQDVARFDGQGWERFDLPENVPIR